MAKIRSRSGGGFSRLTARWYERCAAAGDRGARGSRQRRPAPSEVRPFELDEATISDLQAAMDCGKLTARSLTQKYLARIEAIDNTDRR